MKLEVITAVAIAVIGGIAVWGKSNQRKEPKQKQFKFRECFYLAESDAKKILIRHNEIRKANGIKPLRSDWNITNEAYKRNLVCISRNKLSHDGVDIAFNKLITLGADTAGENLAYGYSTAEGVMKAFVNSAGHYKMVVNSEFDYCGISVNSDDTGRKWVCILYVNENGI